MKTNGQSDIYGERLEDLLPGRLTIRDAMTIDTEAMYHASFTLKP